MSASKQQSRYSAVLFDLDGTLLDTAPDLGNAANHVINRHGIPGGISDQRSRELASDGMRALLLEASRGTLTAAEIEKLKPEFLTFYEEHIADRTMIFPEIPALLTALSESSIPAGVITNKPHGLALIILKKFRETSGISAIIGSRPDIRSKPHPDALLLAARTLNAVPETAIYVGDHPRDMEAAKNAGMTAVLAGWGYIPKSTSPESFGADFIARTPGDLQKFIFS